MINLIANEKLRALGCKWDGKEWIAPKLAVKEANLIKDQFYSDLVVVEVTTNPNESLKGKDWGYVHVRTIGGYIVAKARGRDNGADIMDEVAVIKGKFTSGGSRKNFMCEHGPVVVRLEIGRATLEYLDKEVSEGRYTYVILT